MKIILLYAMNLLRLYTHNIIFFFNYNTFDKVGKTNYYILRYILRFVGKTHFKTLYITNIICIKG